MTKIVIDGKEMTDEEAIKMAAWIAAWAGIKGTAKERWDAVLALRTPTGVTV